MARQRFVAVWLGFALLYLGLATLGPNGLRPTGTWPQTNQHLLQTRAWRGEDIQIDSDAGSVARAVDVAPRLDVTPYFEHWVIADPRERVLLTNIACGVRSGDDGGRLEPVAYVAPDSFAGRRQLERMECHVGAPLGPAFLMYPLRFLLGSALATQWLGALLGGLAVALVDLLALWWLDSVRGEGTTVGGERFRLLVLAGMGTLWIWLVPQGEVWFFAQTVATTGLVTAMVLVASNRPTLAGLAFALAAASRPPVVLAAPMLIVIMMVAARSASGRRLLEARSRIGIRRLLRFGLFPAILGTLHLVLNHLRFGSALEFGYRYMLTPPELRAALEEHGPLSLAFLGKNARYYLVQPPVAVTGEAGGWTFPFLVSDPLGMGLVFACPAFVAALLAVWGSWRGRGLVGACWLSLALVMTPSLLYFNTGWVQWGARYLLDAWPMWLMLTALGLSRINRSVAWLLVVLSVAVNLWAALLTSLGYWP